LNNISVGVKFSYLFGDITHNTISTNTLCSSYSTSKTETYRAYGFLYDFGLQYYKPLGKFKSLTVGAIYSPKIRFGVKYMQGEVGSDPSYVTNDSVFEMPASYGLGFTYSRLSRFTVGADVLYQNWAAAKFGDQTNQFYNRFKINLGGEYIPIFTSNNLLNRLRYRAGLYYGNSYLKVMDSKNKEYGVNLGLGIPMTDRRSFLNLALEYSLVRPDYSPLSERYFKVSLSYTFNELWFFKQRVQ